MTAEVLTGVENGAEQVVMPVVQDPDWFKYRECNNSPDNLTPMTKRGRPSLVAPRTEEETDLITDYCGQCPVVPDCFASSLIKGMKAGIRGGLTQRERRPYHEIYEAKKEGSPIPTAKWQVAIFSARTLRESYIGSPDHRARQLQASSRIKQVLRVHPDGIRLGKDQFTPFHQQFARRLGLSPVIVRQELVAMIENGSVHADTVISQRGNIAITAISLPRPV